MLDIFKIEKRIIESWRKIEDVDDIVRNDTYAFKPFDIYLILKHYNVPCYLAIDDGKPFKYNPSIKMKGMEVMKTSEDQYNMRSNISDYYKIVTDVVEEDVYEITYYVKKTKDIMVDYKAKDKIVMGGIEFKPKVKFLYVSSKRDVPNVFMLLLGGIENKTMRFSQVYYKDEENDIGQLNIKFKLFKRGFKRGFKNTLPDYVFKTKSYKNVFI